MAATKQQETQVVVEIPRLKIERVTFQIRGLSPGLIVHKYSEKIQKEIQDKQQGKAKQAKAPRIPEQEATDARYLLDNPRVSPGSASAQFHASPVLLRGLAHGGDV